MGGSCGRHGRDEMHKQFLLENLKGWHNSKDLVIDGRIILEWTYRNMVGRCGLDASGSG
jgi:hypothetical protein